MTRRRRGLHARSGWPGSFSSLKTRGTGDALDGNMNPFPRRERRSGIASRRCAITLLEVVVLMAVLALVAVLVLPHLTRSVFSGPKAKRIPCVSHLKQAGLSFRAWAMDHGDKFPMSLPVTEGGTMDHPLAHEPWIHYQKLSNELNTPLVLVCPTDKRMKAAASFAAGFGNSNVSYFISLDADETMPQMLLAGDRNLSTNNKAVGRGIYTVTPNDVISWTREMHRHKGNIALADGSVQQSSPARLQQILTSAPRTNRLAIPLRGWKTPLTGGQECPPYATASVQVEHLGQRLFDGRVVRMHLHEGGHAVPPTAQHG
jgi:prepilin-type processing-associated H-X9-DG protein